MAVVLDHVRRLSDTAELTDGELLQLFAASRDEPAFEALMRRHGPLVFGLCRRLLGDGYIAEDVFQATFLVLARKAGSLRKPALLASWLYGVASRLALNERRKAQRRRRHEINRTDLPTDARPHLDCAAEKQTMSTDPAGALGTAELLAALDEELARLPDKYRMPLLLCGVAGKKTGEAARDLGCPEATLKSRLRRGRELLHCRLARRGFALSAATLTTLLDTAPATSAVPAGLLTATARTALPFFAGRALGGTGSAVAVLLAQRLLRSLALQKFAFRLLAALSLALCGGAAALLTWPGDANGPTKVTPSTGGDKAAVAYAPDGKTLVTGSTDGTGLVWDAALLTGPPARPAAAVKAEALTAAWEALAVEDAARAFDGMTTLAAAPAEAVPLLRERLKPAAEPNMKELADWIARLDSEAFAVREEAAAALRKVGPASGPALRKALTANPSAEGERRIETLLAELGQIKLSADSLRALRAIEVLEMIRSPEAAETLKALADGAPGAPETEAAREARQRLGK
jgi:RNA polymerase sigma factor (sigma-70 family)